MHVHYSYQRDNSHLSFVHVSGLFIPEEDKSPIWELLTDYYLHHPPACRYSRKKKLLTQWWDRNVVKCLPYALDEVAKSCSEMIQMQSSVEEMIDVYYDYHRFDLHAVTIVREQFPRRIPCKYSQAVRVILAVGSVRVQDKPLG